MKNLIKIRHIQLELMLRLKAAEEREQEILSEHGPVVPSNLYRELGLIYEAIQNIKSHLNDLRY